MASENKESRRKISGVFRFFRICSDFADFADLLYFSAFSDFQNLHGSGERPPGAGPAVPGPRARLARLKVLLAQGFAGSRFRWLKRRFEHSTPTKKCDACPRPRHGGNNERTAGPRGVVIRRVAGADHRARAPQTKDSNRTRDPAVA